jgi:hypothetical protein
MRVSSGPSLWSKSLVQVDTVRPEPRLPDLGQAHDLDQRLGPTPWPTTSHCNYYIFYD